MENFNLLISFGINLGMCVVMLLMYSVLRRQSVNIDMYFRRRIPEARFKSRAFSTINRILPSPSWILEAFRCTEAEILSVGGLDAVVFIRMIVFSIRIFSIAVVISISVILPLNYVGQGMLDVHNFPTDPMGIFAIGNVKQGSNRLLVHCFALYIISCSACILLYFEYKTIANMRLTYIAESPPNPSHFTILVRAIPQSNMPFSDCVRDFFTKYHGLNYLSHQMIYRAGKVHKLLNGAELAYQKFVHLADSAINFNFGPHGFRCGVCGGMSGSFQLDHNDVSLETKNPRLREKECAAAFVFFKTRYAAVVASQVLQTSNPMLWVTDLAPEPQDVYWSNLWLPYRQLWIRRIATLLGSIIFVVLYGSIMLVVQLSSQFYVLQSIFPALQSNKSIILPLVFGLLPSVLMQLFLCTVPPIMMCFSALEGPISRSARKKSALYKSLYFTMWSVFFVNIVAGPIIRVVEAVVSPSRYPPDKLVQAIPEQATIFITYVLTSGWASLSSEILQLFSLVYNFIMKHIFRRKRNADDVLTFPYHTEVPKVLLFGLLGFTCSILAPLLLPFLLVYFCLGYVVYKNQFFNVYCSKHDTGGQMWPVVHNTTIFSLVVAQILAVGVFGTMESPVASGSTVPLVALTLLFNKYCRLRFRPIFKSIPAQDIIEMDIADEQSGRTEHIHEQLKLVYCQFPSKMANICCHEGEIEGEHLGDEVKCSPGSEMVEMANICCHEGEIEVENLGGEVKCSPGSEIVEVGSSSSDVMIPVS